MRDWAAHERNLANARHLDVTDILAASAEKALVFLSRNRRTDAGLHSQSLVIPAQLYRLRRSHRSAAVDALAHAEVGPCRPDKYGGLTCGEGDGAARVINDTVSPSKRLALAWRSASSPPTEDQTDNNDDLELLVIRLEDGAVLSRRKTDYWDTGEAQVRRTHEIATWSPDSRLMINALDERFKTAVVDLYAFDRDDKTRGAFDLIRIMEPAVRAQHRRRVKDEKRYEFGLDRIEIDNRGLARAEVGLWVPKSDYDRYYEMTLQVTEKGRGFNVKVLYVSPERIRR